MGDTEIAPFLNRLGYMLLAEVDSLHQAEDELWLLHSILTRLTAFLMEVERKQSEDFIQHKTKAMEVITLVHEAEDVTDSYLITIRREGLGYEAHKFRAQIKELMESLKDSYAWFHRFTESKRPPQIGDGHDDDDDDDDAVVVIEDEAKRMIDLLKDETTEREVIPVVGHGGIGKTTFVRKIYNDQFIVGHFPCRSWIYVSNDYKVEELLMDMMKQIISTTPIAAAATDMNETMNLKDLAIGIYKHLNNSTTRYLLVFDDVCEAQFWADINLVFPAINKHGSKIIFTTRYDEVAQHARPSKPPFFLRRLSKEESRALFSKRVNRLVLDSHSHSQLDPIHHHHTCPQEVVDACCGLPLAIIGLAEEYHRRRLPSVMTTAEESKPDNILRLVICELIYNGLPSHLKMCLHYSHFLKEEEGYSFFDYKGLIVAEGLIKLPPPNVEMEDIVEEYLNELIVNMNLIRVQSRSFDGRIKKIVIPPEYYSLSDLCRDGSKKMKSEEVRSLFINHSSETVTNLERIFQDSISLRVLDLINFDDNPGTINLIHLRYLRLDFMTYENPRDFTICLSNLCNLQFLKITFAYERYRELPLQFWKMRQLRHLSLRGPRLDPMINGSDYRSIISLNNLQTLEGLGVEYCTGDVLSMMPNLVTLRLHGKIYQFGDQLTRVFPSLERLRKLSLDGHVVENDRCKLEIFPPNITHLTLRRTCIEEGYLMKALRKLHNLHVLKLKYQSIWEGGDVLDFGSDVDGGFAQLKFLKLQDLFELKKWKLSAGVMPSLQKVAVMGCDKLEGLPSAALEAILTLQELEVRGCNDQVVTDARFIEEHLAKDQLKLHSLRKDVWRPEATEQESGKLHNLHVLKLRYQSMWEGDDILDFGSNVADGFGQLKFLKLQDLSESMKWKLSVGVMLSLQKVAVIGCDKLEGLLSAALEAIHTLQDLEVCGCNDQLVTDTRNHVANDRLKLHSLGKDAW